MSAIAPVTAVVASVAVSTTVATLLSSAGARNMACVFNNAAGSLFIKFGATATTADFTTKLAAGGYFELPNPAYGGIVTGILDSGTGNALVTSW